MGKTDSRHVVRGIVASLLAAGPGVVVAAEEAADSQSAGLEEVIVTAQKREQRINDVGITIAAATGEQLEQRGIDSIDDLARLVPGFTVQESAFNSTSYTLRGVGFFNSDLATPPTVSVYVDEAPVPYPQLTKLIAFGLERVEVMKGPQGTLFGQNATGGAINYIAAKPEPVFAAGVDFGFGRFDRAQAGGFITGPLAETINARLDIQGRTGEPWQESTTRSGDELGRIRELQSRATIEFDGDAGWTSRLTATVTVDRSDTLATQLIATAPAIPALARPALSDQPIVLTPRAADWSPDINYRSDNKLYHLSWRNDFRWNETMTLTSLTAYSRFRSAWGADFDGTPLHLQDATTEGSELVQGGKVDSIFQELRLAWQSDRIDGLLGANYSHDELLDSFRSLYGDFSGSQFVTAIDPMAVSDVGDGRSRYDVDTFGVFGRLEYRVLDDLSVEAAVRYNDDRRKYRGCVYAVTPGTVAIRNIVQGLLNGGQPIEPIGIGDCFVLDPANDFRAVPIVNQLLHEDNVSWRVGVNWKPQSDTLIYANASKGFKAGSIPVVGASVVNQYEPVGQESLLAYETGVKATLFDRSMQVNLAAFYYDYQDKQLRGKILDPAFGPLEALVTIPESEVKGLEAQVVWRPLSGLTLDSSVSYIDTEITEFTGYDSLGQFGDQRGTSFPFAPEWQAVNDLSYVAPLSAAWNIVLGATATSMSRSNSGIGNPEPLKIDSYTLLDVRAGVQAADGRYDVTFWGRNVTNEYYWTSAYLSFDTIVRFVGTPATWGVSFSYRMK